jgi:hypothetical protein
MRRKPFSVVCLQRASPLRHQVKQSRRSSQRSRFLILMTVSLVEPWTYVLSKLSMPTVPPPSSETETWWDTPGDSRLKHNKEERKKLIPIITYRSSKWCRPGISRHRYFGTTARKPIRLFAARLSVIGVAVLVGRGAVQSRAGVANAHGSLEEAPTASTATSESGRELRHSF